MLLHWQYTHKIKENMMDKTYGFGIYYISQVDIWKNKLRLVVQDSNGGNDRYIVMEPKEAQEFVNDIWLTVENHQNTIRKEYTNEKHITSAPISTY
jgi:hypothetical protein